MKTIHSGGRRGLRRPTATLGPSPTSLYAGEEGWPGALGELLSLCGVQHNTQWRIDFCMMMWYDVASWTKLFSTNVELKNGKGQMPASSLSSCPSEKRADQSRGGRAERHRIQARRSWRILRRPPAASHSSPSLPLCRERDGLGRLSRPTRLCAVQHDTLSRNFGDFL